MFFKPDALKFYCPSWEPESGEFAIRHHHHHPTPYMDSVLQLAQTGDAAALTAFLASPPLAAPRSAALANASDPASTNTALHLAAASDHPAIIATLLAHGADPLAANKHGNTFVHTAAARGSLAVLAAAIALATSPSPPPSPLPPSILAATNAWGETPLALAAAAGAADAVAALLALPPALSGAATTDNWGRSPADVAHEHGVAAVIALFPPPPSDSIVPSPPPPPPPPPPSSALNDPPPTPSLSAMGPSFLSALATRTPLKPVVGGTKVSHMFAPSPPPPAAVQDTAPTACGRSTSLRPLSKLIEAPGSASLLATLLADESVDPAGLDAFGLPALLKVAAWNKPELVDTLLPHLTDAEANATATRELHTALHMAVEMNAVLSLRALVDSGRLAAAAATVDVRGRTPAALAAELGAADALAALGTASS